DGQLGFFAGICEFLQIDAAFHLVADVDDGLSRLDGDDPAFDNAALIGGVDFEAFVQEGFEFLHRRFSAHTVSVSFSTICLAMRLAPPVFMLSFGNDKGSRRDARPVCKRSVMTISPKDWPPYSPLPPDNQPFVAQRRDIS